jgi:hypothetical protein
MALKYKLPRVKPARNHEANATGESGSDPRVGGLPQKENKPITAAIIGAIAIILAALITARVLPFKCEKAEIHYLKIMDVKLNTQNTGIRIAGRVNETVFSYPSRGLVLNSDTPIPPQSFRIQKSESGFDCDFDVIVLDSLCQIYNLRPICSLNITDFVYSGVYKMELSNSPISPMKCEIEFKIY